MKIANACHPKSVVVSENNAAVREMAIQVRHVTCREITAILAITSTSIHSIMHGDMVVKQFARGGYNINGQSHIKARVD